MAVEKISGGEADKKLAAGRVWIAGSGHGKHALVVRAIAEFSFAGKFSQINCGAECCPCASCCPCPCGGDSKNDEAAQAADRAIQAAEDLKAR